MNKPQYSNEITKLGTVPQAVERYKLCRTKLLEVAKANGAVYRFGRAVRIDIEKLDKAIEQTF